ncbi:hypothetical protein EVA_02221 [gut metagenome]|uniref:DUF370 domain-containing protein n=1 Tax=gut metagenome TaxID=749906 RepID=J9H1N3_9ZZZZ
MYLHLGQDYIVNTRDILGIFDLDACSVSSRTREFLNRAEKEGAVVSLSDDVPKSFVLTDFPMDTVFLSPISAKTLQRRAARVRHLNRKGHF